MQLVCFICVNELLDFPVVATPSPWRTVTSQKSYTNNTTLNFVPISNASNESCVISHTLGNVG
jgi:hypothetical protein